MRRKNRQIKMSVDIPECYENDEDFMNDFMNRMDDVDWTMKTLDDEDEAVDVPVNSITLGDIMIEPEDED